MGSRCRCIEQGAECGHLPECPYFRPTPPAPAPAPGAAERAGVEALRETLRYIDRTVLLTCGNVHHAKRDRGHPYSAECPVVERIKAKIAAALRGTNQGDQPKAGHDAPLGRGEGA